MIKCVCETQNVEILTAETSVSTVKSEKKTLRKNKKVCLKQ